MKNTREQISEQNGRFTKKETKIENEMKKKGKNEETEKIRKFARNKVRKQRGDIFFKRKRNEKYAVQEFNTKREM